MIYRTVDRLPPAIVVVVVERDFEIAATFIAALIIQRDRIDQLRRVVRHRAAIGLAPANAATRVHPDDNGLGTEGHPIGALTDVSSSIGSGETADILISTRWANRRHRRLGLI